MPLHPFIKRTFNRWTLLFIALTVTSLAMVFVFWLIAIEPGVMIAGAADMVAGTQEARKMDPYRYHWAAAASNVCIVIFLISVFGSLLSPLLGNLYPRNQR